MRKKENKTGGGGEESGHQDGRGDRGKRSVGKGRGKASYLVAFGECH